MDTDLENYKLDELDKVLGLVKNLTTCDDGLTSKAIHDADAYLRDREAKKGSQGQNNDVAAFMSAVEKDAAERAERRTKQRVRAEKLKNKANVFFKAGDWQRAVELYTQAIDLAKDWEILYTNRAQANLRLSDAAAALTDCDAAIFLLDRHTQSDDSVANRRRVEPDPQLAKAHLHRGKALLALRRPSEALAAYSQSRMYAPAVPRQTGDHPWPNYLVGYVAQAEAALAAEAAEARAQELFDRTAVKSSSVSCAAGSASRSAEKTSSQMVSLVARLARGNQPVAYYVAGFRQLTDLFENAPRVAVQQTREAAADPPAPTPPPTVPDTAHRGRQQHSRKRGSRRKQQQQQQPVDRPVVLDTATIPAEEAETNETLEYLQTLFRMKKGFTLLSREVNVVWSSFEPYNDRPVSRHPTDSSLTNGLQRQDGDQQTVNTTDRILVLFNLANCLADDCPENQRILVEEHGNLVSLALKCLLVEVGLVSWVIAQMSLDGTSPMTSYDSNSHRSLDAHVHHKLENLRLSAGILMASLTSHASGRQALLNHFGASVLLQAVAKTLADSLAPNTSTHIVALLGRLHGGPTDKGPFGPPPPASRANSVSMATAVCCAAQVTKVLEHVTGCPSFLLSARSSPASLESLVSVVEAAVSASSPSAPGGGGPQQRSLTTNTSCLASLLDSLAAACQDTELRVRLLQARQPLLLALADCLRRHAGLFSEVKHARLVGSLCRLLHNVFVGEPSGGGGQQTTTAMDNCLVGSPTSLKESVLTGVGSVLDQPGIGPEIRAVAVALAGRVLPLCSPDQVLHWLGNIQAGDKQTIVPSPSPKLGNDPDRCQLLLTILDSCSLSVPTSPKAGITRDCQPGPTNMAVVPDCNGDAAGLSNHLLGGCIRCLAAGTKHSLALRYAIGDDRRRVRRLARILPVRLVASAASAVPSEKPPGRDEVLAGNVCLILQHCCEDTPLAEHLQATSVIFDLLSLIQESTRLDTKRNAAILVGKLASSSHLHRDELSRLDGWSVLTPFNSWSTRLGLI